MIYKTLTFRFTPLATRTITSPHHLPSDCHPSISFSEQDNCLHPLPLHSRPAHPKYISILFPPPQVHKNIYKSLRPPVPPIGQSGPQTESKRQYTTSTYNERGMSCIPRSLFALSKNFGSTSFSFSFPRSFSSSSPSSAPAAMHGKTPLSALRNLPHISLLGSDSAMHA